VAQNSGTPGTNIIYMRGVASGGDGNHSGPLPSVGVYLDEQPVTTIGGNLDVHVYDIARIESLAGPQGTLYGASSEAGTIRIITNKPDTTAMARMDVEVNKVHKGGVGVKVEGMVNIPLSQKAALRVVGFYQKDAGYIDNVAGTRSFLPPTAASPSTTTSTSRRTTTTPNWPVAAPCSRSIWTTTGPSRPVMYQDTRSHGNYGYDPKVGDLQVQHFFPEYRHDIVRSGRADGRRQDRLVGSHVCGRLSRPQDVPSSDYTDYAEAYDSLYSGAGGLAGYAYYKDNAGNQIDRQQIFGQDHFKKMSHELRIASPSTSRCAWSAACSTSASRT
jgi:outer membrane receptor protein involved in Fe transport